MATQFLNAAAPVNPKPMRVFVPQEQISSMEHLGFASFGIYFFLIFSRMPELVAMRLGHSFYQIFIASVLCLVFMLAGGGFARIVGSRMSVLIIGLHIWYAASFPFSYWRSGTMEQLSYIARYLPIAFFTMALVRRENQLRTTFAIMRAAMLITLAFTMTAPVQVSETGDERLQVGEGRFSNSNEIGMYLLIGLPFWLHMATSLRFPVALRLLAGVEIALSLFQCLRTGSRGGLITILFLGVLLLVKSSAINRLKLIVLAVALLAIGVPMLPSAVRARLYSMTGETHDSGAAGSSESRMALLMESIAISAKHPIFGVGVGVYADAAAEISAREGKRKLWQVTHNAYTQVSAEAGLPALAMFLATLFLAIKHLRQSKRMCERFPEMQDLGIMSDCLLLTTLVYMLNGIFANIAQELFYYMICGLSFACAWATQERYDALSQAYATAAASSTPVSPTPMGTGAAPQGTANRAPEVAPAAAKTPVIGRPKPVAPESLYGDVPWARNPNRKR
jgi:O-antigen ligase